LAGLVLGVLNAVFRPLLKLISFPLIILTFGLFTVVINGLILWLVDYIFDFVAINDLLSLFWATFVISLVNMVFHTLTQKV
jgi:putative membrane protein